jgi:NAD(P)-dependent dehydrogenase (short-subunit alcohol dehydrogenase family)
MTTVLRDNMQDAIYISINLQALEKSLKSEKGKLYALKCDVSKESEVKEAFKWINSNLGGVDILINNAGVASFNYLIGIITCASLSTNARSCIVEAAMKCIFTSCLWNGLLFLVYWGGVRLSPLGTLATVWSIVPAPGDG